MPFVVRRIKPGDLEAVPMKLLRELPTLQVTIDALSPSYIPV